MRYGELSGVIYINLVEHGLFIVEEVIITQGVISKTFGRYKQIGKVRNKLGGSCQKVTKSYKK